MLYKQQAFKSYRKLLLKDDRYLIIQYILRRYTTITTKVLPSSNSKCHKQCPYATF
jgi:hypothetical protein